MMTSLNKKESSCHSVGIGFRHQCSTIEMCELIEQGLDLLSLSFLDICCLSTSSHKADAELLGDITKQFGWRLCFFSIEQLAEFSKKEVNHLSHYSADAQCHLGTSSVAESAALLALATRHNSRGRLVLPLQRSPNATLAIAQIISQALEPEQ